MSMGTDRGGRPEGSSAPPPWGGISERPELAARQWDAVRCVTAALHGRLHLEELSREALRVAADLAGATAGSLLLCRHDDERPIYTAVMGPWAAALLGQTAPVERGVVGSVLREGTGRVTVDLGARGRSRRGGAPARPTLLTVPLIAPGGRVIGALQLLDRHHGAFDADDLAVVSVVASLAAAALDTARRREMADVSPVARDQQARLQQELAIGRRIQTSLLPPPSLRLPGFEVVSRCEPAAEVGGDFYDLFSVDLPEGESECWGIVLGDVAGKGIPAALLMAVTTTLIRAQTRSKPSPAVALAAASAELYPRMRPPGGAAPFFATAVCALLDTDRREVRLASAGQTPPIFLAGGRADGPPAAPRYLRLTGLPLGARAAAHYAEMTLPLAPGDRLLFCSDGFVEARDAAGEVVGYTGLLDRIAALASHRSADLVAALFAAAAPPEDDRTAVLITAVS
jgi:sigma-B regulation protein RsbU (phosphoserine phosphatase)